MYDCIILVLKKNMTCLLWKVQSLVLYDEVYERPRSGLFVQNNVDLKYILPYALHCLRTFKASFSNPSRARHPCTQVHVVKLSVWKS